MIIFLLRTFKSLVTHEYAADNQLPDNRVYEFITALGNPDDNIKIKRALHKARSNLE